MKDYLLKEYRDFCRSAKEDKVLAYMTAALVPSVLVMIGCIVFLMFHMPWYVWLGSGLYGAWIWGAVHFGAKRKN